VGRTAAALVLVASAGAIVAGALVVGRDDAPSTPPRAAATTTTTLAACDAPLSDAPTTQPWTAGTNGEIAGFSPGGELFFEPQADIDRDLDAAAAAGVRWLRVDLDWSYLEPEPGQFDWCRADRVIAAARARGLDVLAVPAFAPKWASRPDAGDGFHRAPRDPAEYAAFVTAAVQRYAPAGVHAWEIWNEPNVSAFWKPAPNVEDYVAVLQAAYTAIKDADPHATVLTGGLAPAADGHDSNGATMSIATFLAGLYEAGAHGSFDGIAVHPYSVPAHPMQPHDWNPFSHLTEYHDLMAEHGDGDKPLWLTEFGAPTGYSEIAVHDDVQGDFAAEAFNAMHDWPWVGPLFWYAIRDLGEDPFDSGENWGLLRHNFDPKPGYRAFQALMAEPAP
jgi:hypothetical protein